MPRVRQKKKPRAVSRRQDTWPEGVAFVPHPTPAMVVIEDLTGPFPEVEGRFVKLAPRLPASRRGEFDGPALARDLRDRGALAVHLAPVYLPEAVRPEAAAVARAMDPREAVATWFTGQSGMDPVARKAAEDLVLGFMDLEGL